MGTGSLQTVFGKLLYQTIPQEINRIIYAVKSPKLSVNCEEQLSEMKINKESINTSSKKKSKKKLKSNEEDLDDLKDPLVKRFSEGLRRVDNILRNKNGNTNLIDDKSSMTCTS